MQPVYSKELKAEIVKYKRQNPDVTYRELQERFGVKSLNTLTQIFRQARKREANTHEVLVTLSNRLESIEPYPVSILGVAAFLKLRGSHGAEVSEIKSAGPESLKFMLTNEIIRLRDDKLYLNSPTEWAVEAEQGGGE